MRTQNAPLPAGVVPLHAASVFTPAGIRSKTAVSRNLAMRPGTPVLDEPACHVARWQRRVQELSLCLEARWRRDEPGASDVDLEQLQQEWRASRVAFEKALEASL